MNARGTAELANFVYIGMPRADRADTVKTRTAQLYYNES
jgi:hypothetical protein